MIFNTYRYAGKSTYTMYPNLKFLKSHLENDKEYRDLEIEELSMYELNHTAFDYPLMTGKYEIDYENNMITFHYFCYSNKCDKLSIFNNFLTIWKPQKSLCGFSTLFNSIIPILKHVKAEYESKVEYIQFDCDEDDLDENMYLYLSKEEYIKYECDDSLYGHTCVC